MSATLEEARPKETPNGHNDPVRKAFISALGVRIQLRSGNYCTNVEALTSIPMRSADRVGRSRRS